MLTIEVSGGDAFTTIVSPTVTLTVTPQAVTFTVTLSPDTVVAGETATLTVTSLVALPRLVTVSVSVSETGVLSDVFPSTFVFSTGKTLSVNLVSLPSVSTTSTVELRVTSADAFTSVSGATQTLTVTSQPVVVPPPAVVLEQVTFTVTLSPDTVVAGETATLTITPLSALPRLVTVSVSVSETGVLSDVFPSTLVISTGETTGLTLSVGSLASVSTTSTVELSVSGDASTTVNGATQTLTVTPQPVVVPPPTVVLEQVTFTVTLNPDTVVAGATATLTVTPLSALPRLVTVSVSVSETGVLSGACSQVRLCLVHRRDDWLNAECR